MANMVKVVIVKPFANPIVTEIKNSLEGIQKAIGGGFGEFLTYNGLILIQCENGMLMNRALLTSYGGVMGYIRGIFLVVNQEKGELIDITDEQIQLANRLFRRNNNEIWY